MGSSNIDVTMTTPGLDNTIKYWTVCDPTDSDHRAITFEVGKKVTRIEAEGRFRTKLAYWDSFRTTLINKAVNINDADDLATRAKSYTTAIIEAAIRSIPYSRTKFSLNKPIWWNNQCSSTKAELNRIRRTETSGSELLKNARKKHLRTIRSAKMKSWRTFCEDVNMNVWGKAFKWAKKGTRTSTPPSSILKMDGTETETISETIETFLDTFVQTDQNTMNVTPTRIDDAEAYKPVTEDEVKAAIWRIGPNKSPGLDGINAQILRKAWPTVKHGLTNLYDDCLRKGEFPTPWKQAKMVLIPKGPDKDTKMTKSYRPISLMWVLAKTLETLIVSRQEEEIALDKVVEQHGFTRNKSTVTAIDEVLSWSNTCPNKHVLAVFLDITGAFDNVSWRAITDKVVNMGCKTRTAAIIKSYLIGRQAQLTMKGRTVWKTLTKGCPQGSQLGPTLWKVVMASLAESTLKKGTKWTFYADDIVILAGAARKETAIARLERAYEKAKAWATTHGLSFSAEKSQTMSLKGGLKPDYHIKLGENVIKATSPVTYVGVR